MKRKVLKMMVGSDLRSISPVRFEASFRQPLAFTASSSENLKIDVWNGASWQNVITSLNSGWNNVTVSAYLVSSTFTIRLKGTTDTADTIQDNWKIDATLLHVWT